MRPDLCACRALPPVHVTEVVLTETKQGNWSSSSYKNEIKPPNTTSSFVNLSKTSDRVPAGTVGGLYTVTLVCLLLIPVYLFMGLMMMYLLLRALHKMADLHGLTTFLQLPRCEESDQDEDREPIVEEEHQAVRPCPAEKASSKPLDPGSQSSYNTINKDWVMWRQNEQCWLPRTAPQSQLGLGGWTGETSLLFLILSFSTLNFENIWLLLILVVFHRSSLGPKTYLYMMILLFSL